MFRHPLSSKCPDPVASVSAANQLPVSAKWKRLAFISTHWNDACVAVNSVRRAMAVLQAVSEQPGGLVELASRLKLPTTTTTRILRTLELDGGVHRTADGRYHLGPAITRMASASGGPMVQVVAHPHMSKLAYELNEAVGLSIPSGRESATVLRIDADKPITAEDWTGTRIPLHAGCLGLVTLALQSDKEVDTYLEGELERFNEHTVTDPREIRKRLAKVRISKTLWTHGEYVDGLSSTAAAIVNEVGSPVAALFAYGPSFRFPAEGQADQISARVTQIADEISAELSGRPNHQIAS